MANTTPKGTLIKEDAMTTSRQGSNVINMTSKQKERQTFISTRICIIPIEREARRDQEL